jgi:hypothetical protein
VTPEQARLLVIELTAAFPYPQIPEPTTQLYVSVLTDLDAQVAAEVIRDIVRVETRWPPLGLVLAAYRRRLTWHGAQRAETHGLPEPGRERPPVPDEVYAWIERQRKVVAGRKADRERRRAPIVWQDTTPIEDVPVIRSGRPRHRRWRRWRRA